MFEHKQVLVNKSSLTLYTGVFINFKISIFPFIIKFLAVFLFKSKL
jgi:hypothetical protein